MSRCDQKDELGRITNSQLVVRIEKTMQTPMHVAQFCATGKPVACSCRMIFRILHI